MKAPSANKAGGHPPPQSIPVVGVWSCVAKPPVQVGPSSHRRRVVSVRRCILTTSPLLHSAFSHGLEVAFFGKEASRKVHVGFGDETGGCHHPSLAAGRSWQARPVWLWVLLQWQSTRQRTCPSSLLPPCLVQGCPSSAAMLCAVLPSVLAITPSLCA